MTLHRAFVQGNILKLAVPNAAIALPNDVVHRFTRVLRLTSDSQVELFDGAGLVVTGHIDFQTPSMFMVSELRREVGTGPRLVLIQGLVKQDKLESIIQDSTELGVHQFILFSAAHSVVKVTERTENQVLRLRKIAIDSARQCERSDVPDIVGPITFAELISRLENASKNALILVGEPRETMLLSSVLKQFDKSACSEIMLVIGPEGGLGSSEIAEFERLGAKFVRYAPHVLRTQTAGLVGMSIIQSAIA